MTRGVISGATAVVGDRIGYRGPESYTLKRAVGVAVPNAVGAIVLGEVSPLFEPYPSLAPDLRALSAAGTNVATSAVSRAWVGDEPGSAAEDFQIGLFCGSAAEVIQFNQSVYRIDAAWVQGVAAFITDSNVVSGAKSRLPSGWR